MLDWLNADSTPDAVAALVVLLPVVVAVCAIVALMSLVAA